MKNILFVCTGNTCRSPMAEALLKSKGKNLFRVKSAGLFAMTGTDAHPHAKDVLKNRTISIDHKSKQIGSSLINWSDLILTMTEEHKLRLLTQFPDTVGKVYTLKEYVLFELDQKDHWQQYLQAISEHESKKTLWLQELQNPNLSVSDRLEREERYRKEITENESKIQEYRTKLPNLNIADPYGGSKEDYERTCRQLEDLIDQLVEYFKKHET
ncbi:low molecular weight protein arginine phosphatase [Terrilactibacillus laevilacticus]|uniref:Low molecular weight protein arginine phosphatase n=1 Tax=Terrilactibacillus laevilacticus TaxID=1380157 RepID=A0ABW5PNF9_9BACI|nr:low molecular weight protein arginine phosphatase [Terrilactibacillus laevilacticus]